MGHVWSIIGPVRADKRENTSGRRPGCLSDEGTYKFCPAKCGSAQPQRVSLQTET